MWIFFPIEMLVKFKSIATFSSHIAETLLAFW
jgi:hypothetical protein